MLRRLPFCHAKTVTASSTLCCTLCWRAFRASDGRLTKASHGSLEDHQTQKVKVRVCNVNSDGKLLIWEYLLYDVYHHIYIYIISHFVINISTCHHLLQPNNLWPPFCLSEHQVPPNPVLYPCFPSKNCNHEVLAYPVLDYPTILWLVSRIM